MDAHSTGRAKLLLLAFLAWVMLPNAIWLAFDDSVSAWVAAGLVPALMLVVLLAVFGRRPAWVAALLLPAAALSPVEAYYVASYHHPSSAEILATLAASNAREAWEYAGPTLFLLVLGIVVGAGFAVTAARVLARSGWSWRHRSRSMVLLGTVLLPLGVFSAAVLASNGSGIERVEAGSLAVKGLGDPVEQGYPFGVIARVADYARQWSALRKQTSVLAGFRFGANRVGPPGRRVIVLVVGESSRRDRWQLFGANRPTNPELMREPNLVPLPDLVSPWPASITAIPVLLTRKPATEHGLTWREPSVIRAMSEAGFDTFWLSNQMAIGKYDSPVSVYALEAAHVEFLNRASWTSPGSYDETLLNPLREALAGGSGDMFIVLHTMGSHGDYDYRYPPAFKRFRPTMDDPSGGTPFERRANSYDNTILYTDHVLAEIIDVLRASNTVSVLWYESDHGEDLPTPTCELKEHGNGTPHDFEVPAFVWYSDAYATQFPHKVENLRAHASQKTASTNVFETLVDLAGLAFPSHDASMSLASPSWHERPRPVTGMWTTDYDRAPHSPRCDLLMPLAPPK